MEVEVAMTEREQIYANIRRAIADVPVKTAYPQWNERIAVSCGQPVLPTLWEVFSAKLVEVNGRPMEGIDPVGRYLHESGQLVGYCDPGLAEGLRAHQSFEGLELCTEYDEGQIDHYAFGITRATGAIAETGTIVLNDQDTTTRLGALTPWTHVAILRAEDLWPDLPTALTAVMDDDPSIVFVTGPSKTADVEGILVQGVHGPGMQICCLFGE